MMTRAQYIETYAQSHRHVGNQVIHLICVPAIFAASIALGWCIPVGRWLPGVPADIAAWINGGTLAVLPILAFYARLGFSSFVTGATWLAVSLGACVGLQAIGAPLFWIAAAVWIVAWAVQFVGHKLEGAKPSFLDDLLFLLIGPLFVRDKLVRLASGGSLQQRSH